MKKLSANVLAVDTKLLLKRSLSAGGPAGVIACPVNGQLGHGDSVSHGVHRPSAMKDSLPRHFWVNKKNS